MDGGARIRVAVITGSLLLFVGCGRSARGPAMAGSPPEVVKPMLVPPSPYYLIYSPPVDLAKPPDTTTHARKPRS